MRVSSFFWLVFFVFFVIWGATRSPAYAFFWQKFYYNTIAPLVWWNQQLSVKVKAFKQEVKHSTELSLELNKLKKKNIKYGLILRQKNQLEKENKSLRAALDFQQKSQQSYIACEVIRYRYIANYQIAIINKGSNCGIKEGQTVIAKEGLVGRVYSTNPQTAQVLLISNSNSQVAAMVADNKDLGIIQGYRNETLQEDRLILHFLSLDTMLNKGDKVYTTGTGGVFPAGILIGTLQSWKSNNYKRYAIVDPVVNLQQLSIIFILSNEQ